MLTIALAVVLVPFLSTRCLAGALDGCPISADHRHAASTVSPHDHQRYATAESSHAHAPGRAHRSDPSGSHPRADHTCCEITGKYAFSVSPPAPLAAPTLVYAVSQPPDQLPSKVSVGHLDCACLRSSHDPPRYLRLSALLI